MKLLCTGDFQLGAGTAYGPTPTSRLEDQRRALLRIAALAHEERVAAVVFLGDLAERRNPTALELLAFEEFVEALSGRPLYLMKGNHDGTGAGEASVLSLWANRDGCVVLEAPERRDHIHHPARAARPERAYLCFLPWAHPGHMRARTAGRATPAEQAEALVEVAAGLRAQCPPGPALLFLHWALSGCSLPGGLPTGALHEPVLPLDDLLAQGWHSIVAGHIHKLQRPAPNVYVAGSPYVCDFGEAKLMHGCWVLDTEAPSGSAGVPHELPDRPFVDIYTDPTDPAHGLILPPSLAGAVVRARLKCTEEEAALLDVEALKREWYEAGAHKVYAVEVEVDRPARARAEGLSEEVAEAHALELYIRTQAVEDGLAAAMRERHTLLTQEG